MVSLSYFSFPQMVEPPFPLVGNHRCGAIVDDKGPAVAIRGISPGVVDGAPVVKGTTARLDFRWYGFCLFRMALQRTALACLDVLSQGLQM